MLIDERLFCYKRPSKTNTRGNSSYRRSLTLVCLFAIFSLPRDPEPVRNARKRFLVVNRARQQLSRLQCGIAEQGYGSPYWALSRFKVVSRVVSGYYGWI